LTENDLENVLEKFQISNTSLNFQGLQILGNGLRAIGKLELSEKVLEASIKWVDSNNTKAKLLISLGNNLLSQAQNIANIEPNLRLSTDDQKLQTLVNQSLSNYQESVNISTDKLVQIQGTINNINVLVKFTKEIGDLDTYVQFQINTLPKIINFLNQVDPTPKSIRAKIKLAEIFIKIVNIDIEKIKDESTWAKLQTNITELTPPSELLNQAIEEAKDINNFRLEAYGLGAQAKFNLKKGNLEKALKLTNKALLTAQKVSAYDIVYQLQEQLGDIFIEQGNYSEALLADKSAFNTLQVLRRDLVALNRNIQFNFRDSIEPLYRKLLDLLLQPELGSNQPNVENIKVAVEVIESLQLAELDNFFQDACVNAQDINIDEIDENVAVIYPILFKDRLSVILKLPGTDSFRYATVSENDFQAKFEKNLLGLRVNITSLKRKPRLIGEVKFQSNQLYNWLIKPFEGYLEIDLKDDASQIKTLVFVLEGNLRNIPMSVLYDSKRERYLVERYAIAVAPSLELLPPKPLLKQQIRVLTTGTDKEAPSYRQRG
ncbi:MAG: CHAT domain-containing protein, partial [Trichodesmium sp. St19_bin1]|nr:CHAT domain-containing protein [Trichodesmium sp. St19_bin1]